MILPWKTFSQQDVAVETRGDNWPPGFAPVGSLHSAWCSCRPPGAGTDTSDPHTTPRSTDLCWPVCLCEWHCSLNPCAYKQEAYGPHCSPEKQFQAMKIFLQSYDYIIVLIRTEKNIVSFLNKLESPSLKNALC